MKTRSSEKPNARLPRRRLVGGKNTNIVTLIREAIKASRRGYLTSREIMMYIEKKHPRYRFKGNRRMMNMVYERLSRMSDFEYIDSSNLYDKTCKGNQKLWRLSASAEADTRKTINPRSRTPNIENQAFETSENDEFFLESITITSDTEEDEDDDRDSENSPMTVSSDEHCFVDSTTTTQMTNAYDNCDIKFDPLEIQQNLAAADCFECPVCEEKCTSNETLGAHMVVHRRRRSPMPPSIPIVRDVSMMPTSTVAETTAQMITPDVRIDNNGQLTTIDALNHLPLSLGDRPLIFMGNVYFTSASRS